LLVFKTLYCVVLSYLGLFIYTPASRCDNMKLQMLAISLPFSVKYTNVIFRMTSSTQKVRNASTMSSLFGTL